VERITEARFEIRSRCRIQRLTWRAQHFVHDRRNAMDRSSIQGGTLQQRIATALLIRFFLSAFLAFAPAGVLPAIAFALQHPAANS